MARVTNWLSFVEPQLLTPIDQPPQGSHWIHEIKHDGYRTLVVIERGKARAYTLNRFEVGRLGLWRQGPMAHYR